VTRTIIVSGLPTGKEPTPALGIVKEENEGKRLFNPPSGIMSSGKNFYPDQARALTTPATGEGRKEG